MLKSILIGLDGSTYSNSGIELAIQWGKLYQAKLVGLGIIDKPGVDKPESVPIGASAFKKHTDEKQLARAQQRVQKILERFTARCEEEKVPRSTLEEIGVPYEEILQEAQRHDLLILGEQTYFEFDNYDNPGKTLQRVLKNSPRPVVTVPKRFSDTGNILIAYDGSLQAAHALEAFAGLQLYRDGEVHILSVDDEKERAAFHATIAKDFLKNHGVTSVMHSVESDEPADEILRAVRRLKAKLLVMGAYGEAKLKEFFFGSVTKTVMKKANIPLFLYH